MEGLAAQLAADGLSLDAFRETVRDELLIQPTFYPFEMTAQRRDGVSLQPVVAGPSYEGAVNGRVNVIDASAILANDGDRLHVFTVNRSLQDAAEVHVRLVDRTLVALESAEVLTGPGPKAVNTFEQPDMVAARPFTAVQVTGGSAVAQLPPLSVAAMTFRYR